MSAPAVTVVIGVFNRAGPIVACLDSLLASTFRDFEVVLVEDASTDGSAEVLERYLREHPGEPLRLLINPRNRGASGARNVGMEAARGELVLFTDSDCVVEPSWLEELVVAFRQTGAQAVSGTVLDRPATTLAERGYAGSCLIASKPGHLMEGNMGLRRELGLRFDESLFGGEGDDLACQLRRRGGTVSFAPRARVHHHHPLDLRSYLAMARAIGRGHALYWYKHGGFLGRDILLGGLALLTAPLLALGPWGLVPGALASLQLCAVVFNEVHYKRKRWREALAVLPVQLAYYAVRTVSALHTRARVLLGLEPAIVASRRSWRAPGAPLSSP